VAATERRANRRRGHRRAIDHQRLDHVHAETEPPPQVAEQIGVATRATAEPVVEADDDLARGEPVHEDVLHERLRLDGGQLAREVEDDGAVHAAGGDELEPLVERRDQLRRAAGLEHLEGMWLKGTRQRRRAGGARVGDGRAEDDAMAEMDAVEDAEGDRARAALRRDGRKAPDDPHAPFSPAVCCGRSSPLRPRPAGRPSRRTRARASPPPPAPPRPPPGRGRSAVRRRRWTSTPSRASSYSRRPSWWTAEYIGGTCVMRPTKPRHAASSRSRVSPVTAVSESTRPVRSCVSVVTPKRTVVTYSLSWSIR